MPLLWGSCARPLRPHHPRGHAAHVRVVADVLVAVVAVLHAYLLVCVVVAGGYGAATVSRRILLVQAVPAVLLGS